MKKWFCFILCMVLLTGCAAQETFETLADGVEQGAAARPREVALTLPDGAAALASESDAGTIYECDGYEIMVQTLPAGDLNATVQTLSGYERSDVTVMQLGGDGWKRFEFVWASAGEEGDRLGKAAVLDDGNFHYCLSVLGDAARTREFEETWESLFSSFKLV